jgi:serine/threonine-protein kinase
MSDDPKSSSDGDNLSSADTELGELLAEVAKGPEAWLLPEGTAINEYRVVKLLGRGAFGAVYHAVHAVIGKQVAVKVLNAQFSEDATMAARFVDEARAVNRIGHPNIVDIFGFGALADGRKYCVMELLTGETLGAYLERRGRLPVSEAVEILSQVASALDAAHAASVVHRDLKPDNVLLSFPVSATSADGAPAPMKVKLLDFGIAQMADGLHRRTGSNMVLGTPAYMSPEQCRGAQIDFRSDIYALGVVAFEVLTGTLPFEGTNAFQVTSQHLTDPPPSPSSRVPALGARIDAAVLSMLSKTPSERPVSALEAIRALAGDVPGIVAASGTTATTAPVARPSAARSRPVVAAAAGALALLALVGLAGRRRMSSSSTAPSRPPSLPVVERAAPAAPFAAPPASATVTLRIDGQPASARVFLGKRELGKLGRPFVIDRADTPVALRIRAPGFAARELVVTPARDQVLEIKLVPAPRRAGSDLEY